MGGDAPWRGCRLSCLEAWDLILRMSDPETVREVEALDFCFELYVVQWVYNHHGRITSHQAALERALDALLEQGMLAALDAEAERAETSSTTASDGVSGDTD
jgi:hypothetical protein